MKVGQVLAGKYQIERVLGMGGMGVVVAARHLHLEERVAIKFLQPDAVKVPVVVTRFLREAKAAAKIRSEHVARVFDVGTLDDGAPYLVMEYLEGNDLAAAVKQRGPLPVSVAVDYMLQACEAIAEAHAAGIIHRDLKPANLFLTARADGSHVVKVIDFGISKVTTDADAGMDITKTAEMRGSLLFMPPEQMYRPRDVDPRSDIWALGVSLYNLLTGTYPFVAETVPHLCAMVLNGEPTPPRAYRPEIPAALEATILQCLMKNPTQRFADVAKLAAVLVEFGTPAARVSAERIAGTLKAATERKTQPSASAIDVGRGSAAPPEPTRPNKDLNAEPPLRKVEAPVPGATRTILTQPLPTNSPATRAEPTQTAHSTWEAAKSVGTSGSSSKRSLVVLGIVSALTIMGVVTVILVGRPRSTTTKDAPPTSSAVASAATPPQEQPPTPVEQPSASGIGAVPSVNSASSGPRAAEAPPALLDSSAGKSSRDAKRGSATSPVPKQAPGAPPTAATGSKKPIDDMFTKPD